MYIKRYSSNKQVPRGEAGQAQLDQMVEEAHDFVLGWHEEMGYEAPPNNLINAVLLCQGLRDDIQQWTDHTMEFYRTLHLKDFLVMRGPGIFCRLAMRQLFNGTHPTAPRPPFTGRIIVIVAVEGQELPDILCLTVAAYNARYPLHGEQL